ncbi:MAG: alcohol dehydrogenase catalytic domain-containing protein [Armatimonadota bacterium]|nr:alcohol dehydrogenase catalytic domain-containing protein [Armatimonadota bacterium]
MPTTTFDSLPRTMRAVVCHGPEDYRLEELAVPHAGPGEVVVKIEAAGICASDVKCYIGAPMFWGDANRQGYCQAPITAGHEFIGTVVALGEGAGERHGLELGDRAISEQIVPCWECRYCKRGQYHLCLVHDIYGFHTRTPGGFAEYMKFPIGSLNYKVPRHIPPEHAALIEPLACSMHAVRRAGIEFGDTVVIAGCGTLGLGMVAYAAMKSPAALVAIDLADDRLQRARQLGATHTLNPRSQDAVGAIRDMTEGYGCDVYIEATGNPAAVEQGLLSIRKAGTFVEFSVMREPVTTDWTIIGDTKELDIRGAHLGPHCYPSVIQSLASGAVDASVFISHELPLEEYVHGIELVHAGQASLKVLLKP